MVTIKSTEHKDQEAFQNSDEFKEKAKSRCKIEAKNRELKHRHGYDVATSAALFGMQIQGAMTIYGQSQANNHVNEGSKVNKTKGKGDNSFEI